MIRVETGSRLHFGLISLGGDGEGVGARRFGGAGMMLDAPGVVVRVEEADDWMAEGPLAERALAFAQRVARGSARGRIVVGRSAPEHSGLGTGTQLALAVAKAIALSEGRDESIGDLARLVGRGRRSGLGVHGFSQGGFLVDGGKGSSDALAPLLARVPFPEDWRVLLVLPAAEAGLAGPREQAAFDRLMLPSDEIVGQLCRLVLLGMLPALIERDASAFGEAVYEFNARSGELFAPVQGGIYASAEIASVVAWLRAQGVRGAGQSSWGPGVFGIVEDVERGEWLRRRAGEAFPQAMVWLTTGRNAGASAA